VSRRSKIRSGAVPSSKLPLILMQEPLRSRDLNHKHFMIIAVEVEPMDLAARYVRVDPNRDSKIAFQ